MRIVTLNTWKCDGDYRERLKTMVEVLHRLLPDVVMLQEVFASEVARTDTAAYLARALDMVATAAPARRKPRWFEGRVVDSTSGLALLTRQPPREHHVMQLPSDERDGERVAQLARLSHRGQGFWLANLHLTHLADASLLRTRQLQAALSSWQTHASSYPLVLGGDFNAEPGTDEFEALLRQPWGLIQPFPDQVKQTYRNEDGSWLDVDHLLLSGWSDQALLDRCVLDSGSDHRAVVLTLSL